MFGKKEILERLDAVEQENKRLLWLLNNKPKYKVGQKLGNGVVENVVCSPIEDYHYGCYFERVYFISGYEWKYEVK